MLTLQAIGSMLYHNVGIVNRNLVTIITSLQLEMGYADALHYQLTGASSLVQARFNEWVGDHFATMAMKATVFASLYINQGFIYWRARNNHPQQLAALAFLGRLNGYVTNGRTLAINLQGVRGLP